MQEKDLKNKKIMFGKKRKELENELSSLKKENEEFKNENAKIKEEIDSISKKEEELQKLYNNLKNLMKETDDSIALGEQNSCREAFGFYNGVIFAIKAIRGEEYKTLIKPKIFDDEIVTPDQEKKNKEKEIRNRRKNLKK